MGMRICMADWSMRCFDPAILKLWSLPHLSISLPYPSLLPPPSLFILLLSSKPCPIFCASLASHNGSKLDEPFCIAKRVGEPFLFIQPWSCTFYPIRSTFHESKA